MSSLFGLLFACCLRSHTSSQATAPFSFPPTAQLTLQDAVGFARKKVAHFKWQADANVRISLPVIIVEFTSLPSYVRDTSCSDRQKVKERLGNIVRSKEGKMVNVTEHLPFNLQNRDNPAASSSRLRAESPSPHPSVGTAETATTSRSGSSLRPRGGRFGPPKEPALSVRLVRGRDGTYRGSTSRGRLGKSGEERGVEWTRIGANGMEGSSNLEDVPALYVSDPDTAPPDIVALEGADRENILSLSAEIGKQLRDGWKIEEAGPISRGWED